MGLDAGLDNLRNPRQIKADKRAWMISASNTVATGTATLMINVVMSMIIRPT
jgi:hypothetical protein